MCGTGLLVMLCRLSQRDSAEKERGLRAVSGAFAGAVFRLATLCRPN